MSFDDLVCHWEMFNDEWMHVLMHSETSNQTLRHSFEKVEQSINITNQALTNVIRQTVVHILENLTNVLENTSLLTDTDITSIRERFVVVFDKLSLQEVHVFIARQQWESQICKTN